MRGRLRVVLCLICLLCLGGCSFGIRLAYNNLDWLVQRQLDDFVSLSGAQEKRFEAVFDNWWQWHRHEQLPAYAKTLRALAAQAADGVTREEIDTALGHLERFYLAAMEHSFAELAKMTRELSDEQVGEILDALDEDLETFREERVEATPEERRERRQEQTRRALRARLGRLGDRQQAVIERWAGQHQDLTPQWLASREAWQARFAEVLAARQEPGFVPQLRELFFNPASQWPEGHADAVVQNQLRQLDMLAEVFALATPRQLEHLREELLDFARICERLARRD